MKKIVTQIILAFLLATVIMAIPLYFEKQKTIETRIWTERGYETVGSPAPAAAVETEKTTTAVDKNKVDYTNIYMMIFVSITISFIITIIFIRIRI